MRLNGERNGFVGDFSGSEWAGARYSPDGKGLFANIQTPRADRGDHGALEVRRALI